MISMPGSDVVRALALLEGDERFCRVIGWLRAEQSACESALRSQKGEVETRWLQGATQVLEEFLSACDTAGARKMAKTATAPLAIESGPSGDGPYPANTLTRTR